MKKIFLSLPMSGRSDDEIEAQIAEMKAEFLLKNPLHGDEEIIFVHNFEKMEAITSTYNSITGMERVTPALFYLGRAINKMAYCDGVYFGKGWTKARGCMMEYNVALEYGLSRYIRLRDGSIQRVSNKKNVERIVY